MANSAKIRTKSLASTSGLLGKRPLLNLVKVRMKLQTGISSWSIENSYSLANPWKNIGKPTIVIDFPALTHAIFNNRRDAFYGGRNEHVFRKTEKFFKVFKEKGVDLVFFEDGPVQVDKSEVVVKRQNEKFQSIFNLMNDLYKQTPLDELVMKYDIKLHGSVVAGVREIARSFGSFQKSYHNECDKEVAAYATKVNAIAVISDDTDFLIYEGNWNYWSSRHINFNELTTKNYSKTTLQRYLRLNENEMALFATLAGNDIIRLDFLVGFHRYLGNPWYKFRNISQYIIQHFRNLNSYDPGIIARQIFGNINELSEYTELVRKSLNSYNIHMLAENNSDGNDFMHRLRSIENDSYVYLLDMPRSSTISYFDVRTPQFDKYPELALDMIRRQMGIILKYKNDKTLTRHIYCYQNGLYVYETLHPEYPSSSVPCLEDLYNPDKNGELKMLKMQLLVWVVTNQLDISSIMHIDKKYFIVCLTLFYMVEKEFITVHEADIFLHSIEMVYEKFSTIVDLPYLERYNHRSFQIVFLYDKVYQNITHAVSNCGLFELIVHNHMDGLYLHYALNKMCEPAVNEQLNGHLEHLRLYKML